MACCVLPAATSALVVFFSDLRRSLRTAVPNATLTYTIDGFFNPPWATRFVDIPALAAAVDLVFLMCYDAVGLWGQPHPLAGANSPLVNGPADYGYDIAWQLNQVRKRHFCDAIYI
jgi:GH18 family chitinase